jgi:hypothetical protein
MPRLINYPRASFAASYDLAAATYALGGKSDIEVVASSMGKKVTGSFQALFGAAVKFGLVSVSKGAIITTPLFKSIQLAYTDDEAKALKTEAFLSAPVFRGLAEKFDGMVIPSNAVLSKMLIKEYEVDDSIAPTVVNYFLDGAKALGILDSEGKIRLPNKGEGNNPENESEEVPVEIVHNSFEEERTQNAHSLTSNRIAESTYVPFDIPINDRRRIQIPLPQKRMAELIVPDEMTLKDFDIIKAQLEVLRIFIENS